jgi:hypothetical protein
VTQESAAAAAAPALPEDAPIDFDRNRRSGKRGAATVALVLAGLEFAVGHKRARLNEVLMGSVHRRRKVRRTRQRGSELGIGEGDQLQNSEVGTHGTADAQKEGTEHLAYQKK